jgi:DNA-binding protein HU-beta
MLQGIRHGGRHFPEARRQLVNRSELVESVETATGLDRRQSESAVKAVVDAVVNEIKSGAKVSIFGFGTFAPTSRAARVGRNPQTGAAVNIAASTGVRFAPATALKALLNPKPAAKKSGAKKAAAAAAPAPAKKSAASAKAASAPASAKKSAASAKKAPAPAPAPAKNAAGSTKKSAKATKKK